MRPPALSINGTCLTSCKYRKRVYNYPDVSGLMLWRKTEAGWEGGAHLLRMQCPLLENNSPRASFTSSHLAVCAKNVRPWPLLPGHFSELCEQWDTGFLQAHSLLPIKAVGSQAPCPTAVMQTHCMWSIHLGPSCCPCGTQEVKGIDANMLMLILYAVCS